MDPGSIAIISGAVLGAAGNILGGNQAAKAQREANEKNAALQKEFAQQGIRWRVEDAKAAGIHPLYALGANTISAAPSYVGDPNAGATPRALGDMGQNIGRAIHATRTNEERQLANIQLMSAKTDLEGRALDNQIKAATLKNLTQPATPSAGTPGGLDNFIPGQGNSPIKINPAERTASQKGRLSQEAGWTPDVAYARTDTGLTPVPSKDVKERIEDQLIPEIMWAIRNQLMPNITGQGAPPLNQLPKGYDKWRWNKLKQEWQPSKGNHDDWAGLRQILKTPFKKGGK